MYIYHFCTHFDHFGGLLDWKGKNWKKLCLVHTFFKCGLSFFFIFSQETPQNFKKLQISSKKGTKVGCTFSLSVRARGRCTDPNNIKQVGGQNFTYAKGLVKFGLHLATPWIIEKENITDNQSNGRTNRQTDSCQIYKDMRLLWRGHRIFFWGGEGHNGPAPIVHGKKYPLSPPDNFFNPQKKMIFYHCLPRLFTC